jgi:hypothetical protein
MYLGRDAKQVARQIKALYEALIDQGFTERGAHDLTAAFLKGGGNANQ